MSRGSCVSSKSRTPSAPVAPLNAVSITVRLGAFKPIADFDWDWPEQCDRRAIEELFALGLHEEAANVVWLAYFAAVLDLHTREIVGCGHGATNYAAARGRCAAHGVV